MIPKELKYNLHYGKVRGDVLSHFYIVKLKPHLYIVKLGCIGIYIIFLISAQKIECGYSLEPPGQGGSIEYPQSMFWAENENYQNFLSENFQL